MTFDKYMEAVLTTYEVQKQWRIGQTHANILKNTREDLMWILPDDLDPFYDDSRVSDYIAWVKENW